jgi:hypothetical protein
MNSTAGRKTKSRAEREADLRAARRAEQATIIAGLKTVLESDEQLLGFARGRIAGGFRGKLNIGPEAFFAPIVNIGLTERRLVLQHIHPENGRPSEILPHFFPLGEIASLAFSDIETYGGEPACRLVVHLTNELYCRLRLRGQTNFESAQSIAEVFTSLTGPRRSATTPTQRICPQCTRMLDQPYKYCPYCGQQQPLETHVGEAPTAEAAAENVAAEPDTVLGTPFLPELPIADTAASAGAPVEFAAPAPPITDPEPADESAPEAEPSAFWPSEPLAGKAPPEHENESGALTEADVPVATGETQLESTPDDQAPGVRNAAHDEPHDAGDGEPEATALPADPHAVGHETVNDTATTTGEWDEQNIRYHDDTLTQGEF